MSDKFVPKYHDNIPLHEMPRWEISTSEDMLSDTKNTLSANMPAGEKSIIYKYEATFTIL